MESISSARLTEMKFNPLKTFGPLYRLCSNSFNDFAISISLSQKFFLRSAVIVFFEKNSSSREGSFVDRSVHPLSRFRDNEKRNLSELYFLLCANS